jgi:prolyl oligopeptidase
MRFCCTLLCIILFSKISSQEYLQYPPAPSENHVDTFFGIHVEDPYRTFESPNDETNNWIAAQEKLTKKYQKKELKNFSSIYKYIYSYKYADQKPLIKKGKNFYFFQYEDLYSSPSLFRQASYFGNPSLIIYPQDFAKNREIMSISNFEVSADEHYLAFALSESGKDWRIIRIRDNKRAKFLDDEIKWVKYSNIHWKGNGFFYWRYDEPAPGNELLEQVKNQKLYYHKLYTSQEQDSCVYEIPENELSRSAFEVTSDERYLILYTFSKIKNSWRKSIIIKDLDTNSGFETLLTYPRRASDYSLIDHIENKFYLLTNNEANNYKLICIDTQTKETIVLIEETDYLLNQVSIISNKIIAVYYKQGLFKLKVFDAEGKELFVKDFKPGYQVNGFSGNNNDTETLFFVNSFYFPSTVFKLDLADLSIERMAESNKKNYDNLYETQYFRYLSKDSTAVPMYLTYKKGTDLSSGNNPVLLYGYGGFGLSLYPHFDPGYLLFLNSGGILAMPQVRGGGELGSEWHDLGRKLNKQNSFDDFISAAEYLINTGVTSPGRIVGNGDSNGGLLVAASMTQRPDLFGAAVVEMGVLDMLKYDQYGIGYVHREEYGSTTDSTEFLNLLSYSPYHNVKPDIRYPACLVITAENDDRVPPFHSYKFVSKLQENRAGNVPYLLFLQRLSGHFGSSTIDGKLRVKAFKYSFLMKQLEMELKK